LRSKWENLLLEQLFQDRPSLSFVDPRNCDRQLKVFELIQDHINGISQAIREQEKRSSIL
jgi:hypothetical protein